MPHPQMQHYIPVDMQSYYSQPDSSMMTMYQLASDPRFDMSRSMSDNSSRNLQDMPP
jgi:hypothetical protein